MARTDTLPHFLTDVADAIRTKGGTSETIQASSFDTAISNLPSGGGADLSDYFANSISTTRPVGGLKAYIKKLPQLDTSNLLSMDNFFGYAENLVEIPSIDTSHVTSITQCFQYCTSLTTFPIINLSSIANNNAFIRNIFLGTNNLTDTSVDNVLQSLITATTFNGTKTLANMGFTSTYYPASRIEALPHYQDFIDAGWQIGY